MAFESFAGNAKLKENLISQLRANKLPHAIIIQGEKGLGKKTLAKLIAAGLLCGAEDNPCGRCTVCKNVLKNNHPDVLYYKKDKASVFSVELLRKIRALAFVLPNQSDYKIFILDEADYMNESAQNAFLKILEEPPSYAVFIMLCEHKNNMLDTILSRSTVFTLEPVSNDEAVAYLSAHMPETDIEDIRKTAEYTGGNIGKIIDNLSNEDMLLANETAENIADALLAERSFDLLKAMAPFDKDRKLFKNTLLPLRTIIRNALVLRCGGEQNKAAGYEKSRLLSKRFTKKQLFRMIEVTEAADEAIERFINHQLLITKFCADLHTAAGF